MLREKLMKYLLVSVNGSPDDGEFATLSQTWTKPKSQFVKWHSKRNKPSANFKLGSYQLVQVDEERKIYVANLLVVDANGAINESALQQVIFTISAIPKFTKASNLTIVAKMFAL